MDLNTNILAVWTIVNVTWIPNVQPEHNGEYFDGDSDQDEEGTEEPGGN